MSRLSDIARTSRNPTRSQPELAAVTIDVSRLYAAGARGASIYRWHCKAANRGCPRRSVRLADSGEVREEDYDIFYESNDKVRRANQDKFKSGRARTAKGKGSNTRAAVHSSSNRHRDTAIESAWSSGRHGHVSRTMPQRCRFYK